MTPAVGMCILAGQVVLGAPQPPCTLALISKSIPPHAPRRASRRASHPMPLSLRATGKKGEATAGVNWGPEDMLGPLGIDRPTLLAKVKKWAEPLLPKEEEFIRLGNIACGAPRHPMHRAVHRAVHLIQCLSPSAPQARRARRRPA